MQSIIESILFSIGRPISIVQLSKILNQPQNLVKENVSQLKIYYKKNKRGLRIIEKDDKIQLVSTPDNNPYIEKLVKDEIQEDLTPASMETLAIIAYKGPITRSRIEQIRGVNSALILRNLLIRGLIERENNPDGSRSYVYSISFDFLKKFGLSSVSELPDYQRLINESKEL